MNVCMAVSVYNKEGRLCGVDMIEDTVTVGDINNLKTNITLSRELKKGDKIKILLLKDTTLLIPFSSAKVINVK